MRAHPGGPPAALRRLGSARRPRTGDISSKNTLGKGKLTHTISAPYPVSVAGPEGLLRMPGTRKKKKEGGGKGKVRKEGTYLWPDRRKVAHAVAHFGTIRGRRQGPTRIGTVRKIRTDARQRRRTPGQGGALTLKQGVHVCRGAGRARPAAVPTVPSGTWGYWDS